MERNDSLSQVSREKRAWTGLLLAPTLGISLFHAIHGFQEVSKHRCKDPSSSLWRSLVDHEYHRFERCEFFPDSRAEFLWTWLCSSLSHALIALHLLVGGLHLLLRRRFPLALPLAVISFSLGVYWSCLPPGEPPPVPPPGWSNVPPAGWAQVPPTLQLFQGVPFSVAAFVFYLIRDTTVLGSDEQAPLR